MIPDEADYLRQVAKIKCPFCGASVHFAELTVYPPLAESATDPDVVHLILCDRCLETILADHLEHCVEYEGWSKKWDDERQDWRYEPPLVTFESVVNGISEVPPPPMFRTNIPNRSVSDDC